MMHSNMLHTNGLLIFASLLIVILMPVARRDLHSHVCREQHCAQDSASETFLLLQKKSNVATMVAAMVAAHPWGTSRCWRRTTGGRRRSSSAEKELLFQCAVERSAAVLLRCSCCLLCLQWIALLMSMCAVRSQVTGHSRRCELLGLPLQPPTNTGSLRALQRMARIAIESQSHYHTLTKPTCNMLS